MLARWPWPVLSLCLAALPGPASGQTPPAFGSQASAITVDVVVLDDEGQPVRGLTKQDFTLLEDGRPQAIVGFEARDLSAASPPAEPSALEPVGASNEAPANQPGRILGLVVDDLGISPATMLQLRSALERWIREQADPRDEITITSSSGSVWWSDSVGSGRQDLLRSIGRLEGRLLAEPAGGESLSTWEAYEISERDVSSRPPGAVGGTATGSGGLGSVGVLVGNSVLDRVTARWIRARACVIPPESMEQCQSRIRAAARHRHGQWALRAGAVFEVLKRLSASLSAVPGRKSVLLASEEFIKDISLGTPMERAVDALRRANIGLYFLSAGGLEGPSIFSAEQAVGPRSEDIGMMTLETTTLLTSGGVSLAEDTGGVATTSNDLAAGLDRMALDSSAYYLLGYQPEEAPDGKWHDLKVKVERPGVKVRARRRYLATPNESPELLMASPARGKNKPGPSKRPLHPALLTGTSRAGIPLRLAGFVGETNHSGLAKVEVVLEIDRSRVVVDRSRIPWQASLDLTIMATSLMSGPKVPVDEHLELSLAARDVGDGTWLLRRSVWLPPGVAQIRALVRDRRGALGLVTQRIAVPDIDKVYLSTPVMSDRTIPPTKADDVPQLVPTANRSFGRRDPLYCQFEVFAFAGRELAGVPKLFSEYTLLRADGTMVSASPATPIQTDGHRAVRRITLPIAGLEAGEYVLEVVVEDRLAGHRIGTHVPFGIERGEERPAVSADPAVAPAQSIPADEGTP